WQWGGSVRPGRIGGCFWVGSSTASGDAASPSSGATSLALTSMSAANGWSARPGVDSGAGCGGGPAAREEAGVGPVRVSNVLVRRSRNFRHVGARSPLGRSLRPGSLFDPFFGTSVLGASLLVPGPPRGWAERDAAAGAFGSICGVRGAAGAAGT